MTGNDAYLENLLKQEKKRLKSEKDELKKLPDGYINPIEVKNHMEYVHIIRTMDPHKPYIRKGITKNEQLVRSLLRKRYLERSIKLLTEDIKRIEVLLKDRIEPTSQNVIGSLKPIYHKIPTDHFLPDSRTAKDWADRSYRQNTKNIEEKKQITSKGLKVRSKSELLIAEKLYEYKIPFRYDAIIDDIFYTFSPDFTFLINGKLIYWEHCGMMGSAGYRSYNEWKLEKYKEMGIVPWNNFIITYDIDDGVIDMRVIEAEIRNKLLTT